MSLLFLITHNKAPSSSDRRRHIEEVPPRPRISNFNCSSCSRTLTTSLKRCVPGQCNLSRRSSYNRSPLLVDRSRRPRRSPLRWSKPATSSRSGKSIHFGRQQSTDHSYSYMLRYLRCVQKMKQIIAENNLTVMGTIARYVSDHQINLCDCNLTIPNRHAHTRPSPSRLGGTRPSTWDP